MIQNPASLNLLRGQLQIKNEEGVFSLPLEDITALILESAQIGLTSSLLSACQTQGICVVTCDASHIPNGVLLPFQPHSRQSKVARIQLSWSEAFRKRLWQRVIKSKINNQAQCLERAVGKEVSTRLKTLVGRVGSGDPDNIEAQAARDYWPKLFGKNFRRGETDLINAALNYGYAVVRAFVARSQVSYGLLPTFGIHHENELNAFNLTDDMMEVLRPFIDEKVYQLHNEGKLPAEEVKLPLDVRQSLANAGNLQCLVDGQKHTLANTCDRMAAGLVSAIENKSLALLPLPAFPSFTIEGEDA